MKTINKDIDIFYNEELARKAFNRSSSADLLYAPSEKCWFVDRSKTAKAAWPNKYEVLDSKELTT